MSRAIFAATLFFTSTATVFAEPIRLANNPALSPDGHTLAFDWNGDIWTVPTSGGVARQLTQHPARPPAEPRPTASTMAFISDRDGAAQAYTMPVDGGPPAQVTFNTAGCAGRLDPGRKATTHYTATATRPGGGANGSLPCRPRVARRKSSS